MFRLSLLLIFLSVFYSAQDKSVTKINRELVYNIKNTLKTGKFEEGIFKAQKLIKESEKISYKLGAARGNLDIANFLSNLDQYNEALKYFEIAEKLIIPLNNSELKMELYIGYANANDFLGIYEIALHYYNKVIYFARKRPLTNVKYVLGLAYGNKAGIFENQNKADSCYIYNLKSYKIKPDPLAATNLASNFIKFKKKEIDSAGYYLKIASDSLQLYDYSPDQKLAVLIRYVDYYDNKEDYPKALEYGFLSLASAQEQNRFDDMRDIYKTISDIYAVLKDDDKSAEYLLKYSKLYDSLNAADKQALDVSVNKFVKDKESEKESEKKALRNQSDATIAIISFFTIGLVIFAHYFYRKKKKEKELLILGQQEEIIQTKVEKRNLEHKVNNAFDEVLALAKKNNPAFLARFKEVYPEFCDKLLYKFPDIIASEFTFCAYLKLNLSTKDIANYTFVTEKTVQSRKSRLRKRMSIPSDEDLYVWISKI